MKAHLRYLSYVLRHKWFVLLAGRKAGAPLWRLLIHDWSKFTPAEWGAYVAYFYGPSAGDVAYRWFQQTVAYYRTSGAGIGDGHFRQLLEDEQRRKEQITTEREAAFDRAWLHHQHANPHHWQHWVLREDSGAVKLLPMPEHFLREMVADWMGAGRAITGRWEAGEWYTKNHDVIQLEHRTRIRVEGLLGRHAGLPCLVGCTGGWSPTYCRELGGCEAHCSSFSRADKVALGIGA
jgi:hypothetical protein